MILLFAIGLETDLGQLIKVGATSLTVAVVGVALPFVLGYVACLLLGFSTIVSVMAGATLTATSVGITARVLADLGRLHDPEGQIILGAAVIDDILGLMILTVVVGLTEGKEVSLLGVVKTTGSAIGFLVVTIVVGKLVVPALFRLGKPDRAPRDGDGHGPHDGVRIGLAGPAVRLGNHHRRVRRGPARGFGSASPRDRARNHRDRPFLRAALLRRRGGLGRSQRPRSFPAGDSVRARHRGRAHRGRRGRQAGRRLCALLVSRQQDRSLAWAWCRAARSA